MSSLPAHKHPRPAVAVDLILFGLVDGVLKVLVGRRAALPYKGRACFPGTYLRETESGEDAGARKIKSIGLAHSYLEQLYTFTHPRRDPRERVVSIAYYSLIAVPAQIPAGDDKIDKLEWLDPTQAFLKPWAFDHQEILEKAVERLRSKIQYTPIPQHFLTEDFTLAELAAVYGAILGRRLDLSNFRRDLTKQNLIQAVGTRAVRGPLATTYRWNQRSSAPFFLSLG